MFGACGGAPAAALCSGLGSSTERLDRLESSGELIQISDANGRLLHLNPPWCKALGIDAAPLLGLEAQTLIEPDDRPCRRRRREGEEPLLRQSDQAMYAAQRGSGNVWLSQPNLA